MAQPNSPGSIVGSSPLPTSLGSSSPSLGGGSSSSSGTSGASGSLIAGIGAIVAAGIGAWSAYKQRKAQQKENALARAHNLRLAADQNRLNLEQWNRENAYNSPRGLIARGLNADLGGGR